MLELYGTVRGHQMGGRLLRLRVIKQYQDLYTLRLYTDICTLGKDLAAEGQLTGAMEGCRHAETE